MTTATLGTCTSCGLGVKLEDSGLGFNLPARDPWHVGQKVIVMTESELETLLRAPADKATRGQGDKEQHPGPLVPSSPCPPVSH